MILEIMTREMEAVAYACAVVDLKCKFTPTDKEGIVHVRITDRAQEISAELAYRLGVLVGTKIYTDRNDYLSESDLMPNDVMIFVEPAEDLPR